MPFRHPNYVKIRNTYTLCDPPYLICRHIFSLLAVGLMSQVPVSQLGNPLGETWYCMDHNIQLHKKSL